MDNQCRGTKHSGSSMRPSHLVLLLSSSLSTAVPEQEGTTRVGGRVRHERWNERGGVCGLGPPARRVCTAQPTEYNPAINTRANIRLQRRADTTTARKKGRGEENCSAADASVGRQQYKWIQHANQSTIEFSGSDQLIHSLATAGRSLPLFPSFWMSSRGCPNEGKRTCCFAGSSPVVGSVHHRIGVGGPRSPLGLVAVVVVVGVLLA